MSRRRSAPGRGENSWHLEDLPEQARPTRRPGSRWWGPVILLGVALLVAVPAGARARELAGTGTPRVDLPLPGPGECLTWDVVDTDPPAVIGVSPAVPLRTGAGSLRRAPCTAPHQGEVVRAWRSATLEDGQVRQICTAAQPDTVYTPQQSPSGWTPISGDRRPTIVRTGDEPLDWVACVLIEIPYDFPPAVFTLTAPMGPGTSTGARWCLTDQRRAIGCDRPHAGERIGIADVPRGEPSCTRFAYTVIGPEGSPAFSDSGLTIRSSTVIGSSGQVWICDVVAPPGRRLTSSVIGLGSAPLPLR